jgi:hypothetical protein
VDLPSALFRNRPLSPHQDYIMAVRILLLISCTVLFACAWERDAPPAAASQFAASQRQRQPNRPRKIDSSPPSQLTIVSSEFDRASVVLPKSMSAGVYRIVDSLGRVGWMHVPESAHATPRRQPTSHYSTHLGNRSWHFIRMDAEVSGAALEWISALPQTSDIAVRR